ncbi:MAG: hypothetical protein HOP16_08930 [Acidobacteria bacterium]|nr:hypothetical protein [Acidobacteriota bacterium]
MKPAKLRVAAAGVWPLAGALLICSAVAASAQESLMRRPVSVSATLGNSPKLYNGQYTSSGVGRLCGETDPLQFFGGRQFIAEFPLDYNGGSIFDLRFSSKTLVGSVRETGTFFVSITVKAANGGTPPAYVLDTERPAPRNSGTASLSVVKGEATLTVKGSDSLGQTLELTVTCGVPGK